MNNQVLLERYSRNPDIMESLIDAQKEEKMLEEGYPLYGDGRIQAIINPSTGLWEALLQTSTGSLEFTALDQNLNRVEVKVSSIKSGKSQEVINLQDKDSINQFIKRASVQSCLEKIRLEDLDFIIQDYRSELLEHNEEFDFLWHGTDYKSANQILERISKYSRRRPVPNDSLLPFLSKVKY